MSICSSLRTSAKFTPALFEPAFFLDLLLSIPAYVKSIVRDCLSAIVTAVSGGRTF